MKNKEIEELLNELKRNADKHLKNPLKYTKEYKDYVLLSYIEQLENNRDKAINHLDLFISDTNLSRYDTLKILMYTKKILKGDSDEKSKIR